MRQLGQQQSRPTAKLVMERAYTVRMPLKMLLSTAAFTASAAFASTFAAAFAATAAGFASWRLIRRRRACGGVRGSEAHGQRMRARGSSAAVVIRIKARRRERADATALHVERLRPHGGAPPLAVRRLEPGAVSLELHSAEQGAACGRHCGWVSGNLGGRAAKRGQSGYRARRRRRGAGGEREGGRAELTRRSA